MKDPGEGETIEVGVFEPQPGTEVGGHPPRRGGGPPGVRRHAPHRRRAGPRDPLGR
jgi:hypothetical protein